MPARLSTCFIPKPLSVFKLNLVFGSTLNVWSDFTFCSYHLIKIPILVKHISKSNRFSKTSRHAKRW
jgi:hypothetical protein